MLNQPGSKVKIKNYANQDGLFVNIRINKKAGHGPAPGPGHPVTLATTILRQLQEFTRPLQPPSST